MDNFETKLFKAMSICDGHFKYYSDFSKIYSFTTENIGGYIDYFDFNNKSLLTVGSSGDQVLNAFYNGCKDITLFDINPFAKFYVYLKIAAILSLSYKEFKLFFFKYIDSPFGTNKAMFSTTLFNKIKDTLRILDFESFLFFDELFSMYDGRKIRSRLFDDDEDRFKVIMGANKYLRDEDSYNKLKAKISKIYFNYIQGDIFKDTINGKFDNIFLSNLCTISDLEELKKLITRLDSTNLKDKGSMLLAYLWEIDYSSTRYADDWLDIYKLPVTKNVLGEYISEPHNITGCRDILFESDSMNDLVLIYRKK